LSYTHLVGFGEAMIRLTSPPGRTLPTARSLDVSVGGAELNALVAARAVGMPGTWVTALPDGALAALAGREAAGAGVAVHHTRSAGRRMGLYFVEAHVAPQPIEVTYDRESSAFALLDPAALDWPSLLTPASCLVLSGITPALGDGPRRALLAAVSAAAHVGATIALDVNHRPSLWSAQECFAFLATIVPDVSVLAASVSDLRHLGVDSDNPYGAARDEFDLDLVMGTTKVDDGAAVHLTVTAADRHDQVERTVTTQVRDPIGAGDALFGAALATYPAAGLAAAVASGLGAAVTAYGTNGDLLSGLPWDIDGRTGRVLR
jgi:2-dehydro-3-deoxygluconokinase